MGSSVWDWTVQRRVRFYLRQAIRHLPSIYLPPSRVRSRPYMMLNGVRMVHTGVVRDGTEVVIEGYPRCGNTFSVVAFQLAQQIPVEAAHHLHAESQIIGAARAGIPAILLIREPEEAVVSNATSFGYPLRTALRDYVLFYRRVLPYRDEVVVADFGAVTDTLNAQFETDFTSFDHSDTNVERCFAVIDEFYRRTAPEPNRTVARPSGQRQDRKLQLRAEYQTLAMRSLRHEAEALYADLTAPRRGGDGMAGPPGSLPGSPSHEPSGRPRAAKALDR